MFYGQYFQCYFLVISQAKNLSLIFFLCYWIITTILVVVPMVSNDGSKRIYQLNSENYKFHQFIIKYHRLVKNSVMFVMYRIQTQDSTRSVTFKVFSVKAGFKLCWFSGVQFSIMAQNVLEAEGRVRSCSDRLELRS